jgi:hypothetical protein
VSGSALSHCPHLPHIARMTNDHRIDLRLPRAWRKELDELAAEVGLSASDIARLSIRYLLNHRAKLVKIMDGKR